MRNSTWFGLAQELRNRSNILKISLCVHAVLGQKLSSYNLMDRSRRFLYYVIILCFRVVRSNVAEVTCPGGRATDEGVCYGHGGDSCNLTNLCDKELGYTCIEGEGNGSKCTGKYYALKKK